MTKKPLLALTSVLFLAATAAFCDSGPFLRVSVPFQFNFGNEVVPAGDYLIQKSPTGGVMITSRDGKFRKSVLGIPLEFPSRQSSTRLVFRRYGNEYFLAQIWARSEQWAREIPAMKLERAVIARSTQQQTTEQIAVSAQ